MRNIAVRSSVEAVTANGILFIVFIRNRIDKCLFGHGGMESRIKYHYLGHFVTEYLKAGADALNMSGIVKRCQRDQAFDALDNIFVNNNRFTEQRTALYDTVTDCGNLVQRLDHAVFFTDERIFDLYKRFCMVCHGNVRFKHSAVACAVFEVTVNTDPFAVSFGKNALIGHIDELIFHG